MKLILFFIFSIKAQASAVMPPDCEVEFIVKKQLEKSTIIIVKNVSKIKTLSFSSCSYIHEDVSIKVSGGRDLKLGQKYYASTSMFSSMGENGPISSILWQDIKGEDKKLLKNMLSLSSSAFKN